MLLKGAGIRRGSRYIVRVSREGESLARQAGLIDQRNRPVRGLPPVVVNGALYVSDSNHLLPFGVRRLHALDPRTGAELWRFEISSTLLLNPAVDRDAIYLTSTGQVMALEAEPAGAPPR